jgi:hypothetical protein
MRLGCSLSPGGLLLPYHTGVLSSLQYHGIIDETTHIAGSSAGAIATAAFGCGVSPEQVLEGTIRVSDECETLGGARGRLLPLLRREMETLIQAEQLEILTQRSGITGVAYLQLFPQVQAMLEYDFATPNDLIQAVCYSSTFPFFATNWPVALDTSFLSSSNNNNKETPKNRRRRLPRILVDGYFSVPRNRFGCPDLHTMAPPDRIGDMERTITISVFPQAIIGLNASHPEDCISPLIEDEGDEGKVQEQQMAGLLRLATQASSREELTQVYESGWYDAERWCRQQQLQPQL